MHHCGAHSFAGSPALPACIAAGVTRWEVFVNMTAAIRHPQTTSRLRWVCGSVIVPVPSSMCLTVCGVAGPGDAQLARSFCPKAKDMHIMPRMVSAGKGYFAARSLKTTGVAWTRMANPLQRNTGMAADP